MMVEVKSKLMSVCGVQCDLCEQYPDTCKGCEAVKGKPYWMQYVSEGSAETCDIYECCNQRKKLKHCGHCHELPCVLYEFQDPTKSDEENQKDFLIQMKNLNEIK